jgi:hypothetical protein
MEGKYKMSSGKYKRHDGFNKMQIKNGRIVRLRKDGTVKADMGAFPKDKRIVK